MKFLKVATILVLTSCFLNAGGFDYIDKTNSKVLKSYKEKLETMLEPTDDPMVNRGRDYELENQTFPEIADELTLVDDTEGLVVFIDILKDYGKPDDRIASLLLYKALSNQAINCVKTLQKEMNIDFKTFVMDDTAVLEPGSVQDYIKNKKLSKEMLDVLKN